MQSPPTSPPAPTPRPDPRIVSQRLNRPLLRRQIPANTCGWERGYSYLPLICPGGVCAFDHTRNLFGCCAFDQACELPATCIEYSSYVSPLCAAGSSCPSSSYPDATVCSDPNTPYCVLLTYDSTGDMMHMYTCVTSASNRAIYSYYYTIDSQVAGVLADTKTVTPTNITSIITTIVRSFASASLPPISIDTATSSTKVGSDAFATSTASTAATPPSNARFGSPSTYAAISLGALIGLAVVGLVIWRLHRRFANEYDAPESLTRDGRPSLSLSKGASEGPLVSVSTWRQGVKSP